MDSTKENALPSYDHEETPNNEELPSYEVGPSGGRPHDLSVGPTLAIDPTGMFINELPRRDDAQPLYSLSASLLNVNSRTAIHISRATVSGGKPSSLAVYAIGYNFISPMHNRKPVLQDITVMRTHGLLSATGKIEWHFNGNVRQSIADTDGPNTKKDAPLPLYDSPFGGPPPGMVQKLLLRNYDGKWLDDANEVIALAREGGEECEGMPVLSVVKDLDMEMIDFLVSAWCVTLWEELGKRARHMNRSSGSKFSIGKFRVG